MKDCPNVGRAAQRSADNPGAGDWHIPVRCLETCLAQRVVGPAGHQGVAVYGVGERKGRLGMKLVPLMRDDAAPDGHEARFGQWSCSPHAV